MIKEFTEKIKSREIDVVQHTRKVLNEIKTLNKEYNYFNTISEELALEQAEKLRSNPKGRLAGVPISVKDCIVVKGVESTAGSRILKGYNPVFNATAVARCIDEGAIIIGKTSQDEFGFGGFSTNVGLDYKVPLNPFDKERATGGSSGGSGGISQKASFPHVSLGESTGGSIVNPASFCGVFGLCPTYGRVSRYGLMDYANSLDKIGPMSKSIEDAALVLEIISGSTSRESTSLNKPVENYSSFAGKGVKGMKIGVIKDAFAEGLDDAVRKKVWDGIKKLESEGAKYEEVSLPLTIKYGLSVYYIIATSEASTNLAKYCGMRYGKHEKLEGSFNEYFTKVRSKHFGKEAKRRIILGTFARMAGFRDAYYIKAMKVRTRIINEYKSLFKKYDLLVSPTVAILPPRFDEINKLSLLQNYMVDTLTVGPNLAGLPHLNVPVGFEKKGGKQLPVGMMLIGDHLQEAKLIQAGSVFGR
ncbi:MAG TPA: amidase family protein [Candidatus Nanoarchaeia archaeon]|nr:amidase family protein [Candidatus Nanoarchaeia archaeon]